jgi:SanA protein
MINYRKVFFIFIVFILASFMAIILADSKIKSISKNKLYSNSTQIPTNNVGLLLGTSKYLKSGKLNPYYRYRIEATDILLKNDKIKYLVISGDNKTKNYNEPELMRADLMQLGADSTKIFLDYAGFRTLDSIIRLKKIFGQTKVTIISQKFHNERALFIAAQENIEAVGFNAKDVNLKLGLKVQIREKLARVKVFVDYIFNTEPKFYGQKIEIPLS